MNKTARIRLSSIALGFLAILLCVVLLQNTAKTEQTPLPAGYVKIAEGEADAQRLSGFESLANSFLEQGYGVMIEVSAMQNEQTG